MGELRDALPFLIGFGLLVIIPIVSMLLTHQRRMAELIHGKGSVDSGLSDRVQALESEVLSLREQLNRQIISSDTTKTLENRLES